jgi:DNA-binding transcriptional regulator YhcF (GntR family)
MPTGQGKTWTAHRVGSVRRVRGIHGYRSAETNGELLTMRDAAAKLGVSHHQIRKLIKAGILASEQIMSDAPRQIRAADLVTSGSLLRSNERAARVELNPKIRSQCFRHLKRRCRMNRSLRPHVSRPYPPR